MVEAWSGLDTTTNWTKFKLGQIRTLWNILQLWFSQLLDADVTLKCAWSAIHKKWYESVELSECYHMQNLTFIASVLENNNIVKNFYFIFYNNSCQMWLVQQPNSLLQHLKFYFLCHSKLQLWSSTQSHYIIIQHYVDLSW